MDQGPIKIIKIKYRNLLLCKVLSEQNESGATIVDILKKHTVKDAIVLWKKAWDDVPDSILKTSFKKMIAYDDDDYDEEDLVPLSERYSKLVQESQTYLHQLNPNVDFTVDEIEQWNGDHVSQNEAEKMIESDYTDEDDEDESENEHEDIDDCVIVQPKTQHSDALNYVNGLLKWCDENNDHSAKYVCTLLDLRTEIVNAAKTVNEQPKKQTVLSDFFSKRT